MANTEHIKLMKRGIEPWNSRRPDLPDFSGANLSGLNLSGANLSKAILSDANLGGANIAGANLTSADLTRSNLIGANLSRAVLIDADLGRADLGRAELDSANLSGASLRSAHLRSASLAAANLGGADLKGASLNAAHLVVTNLKGANLKGAFLVGASILSADLSGVDLRGVDLSLANLSSSTLNGADMSRAMIGGTTFTDLDLSDVRGLEMVLHGRPSSIGIDSFYKSSGKIPEAFLRGCGVPDDFIAFIPSHFGIQQAIQFYSCFISYSAKDEEFAARLHSRMRDEKLRVWFAPEELKGGEKLQEQIERAIQVHDRLLVVLSESSIASDWVVHEIRKARETEIKENRRKLFPIRLAPFEKFERWKCLDIGGRDLAAEVRGYFIPDFSTWKEHDSFEIAFKRLLSDLRKAEGAPT